MFTCLRGDPSVRVYYQARLATINTPSCHRLNNEWNIDTDRQPQAVSFPLAAWRGAGTERDGEAGAGDSRGAETRSREEATPIEPTVRLATGNTHSETTDVTSSHVKLSQGNKTHIRSFESKKLNPLHHLQSACAHSFGHCDEHQLASNVGYQKQNEV